MATTPDTSTDAGYTVRAVYDRMPAARRAITALERHGIPGSDIALEGAGAEKAATETDQSAADERFMEEAMRSVAVGGGVGALVGLALGFIGGIIWLGNMGVYLASIAGLFGGGGLGFVFGAIAREPQSEAHQEAYGPADGGEVIVAVRTVNHDDAEKAAAQLRDTDPPPTRVETAGVDGEAADG